MIRVRRFLVLVGAAVVILLVAFGAFSLLAAGALHTFSVRSSYPGVRSIEVAGGDGDVHLTAVPAGSPVLVVSHVTEGFAAPHRQVLQPHPGALQISYNCGASVDCSVSYDITVPAGVPVTVNAGDGSVDATGLDSPHLRLQSGNGDVKATLSQPAVSLNASSGDGSVTLVVPDVSYAVRASSGNGSVNDQSLSIDPHSPRSIDASSGDGDVTITAAR